DGDPVVLAVISYVVELDRLRFDYFSVLRAVPAASLTRTETQAGAAVCGGGRDRRDAIRGSLLDRDARIRNGGVNDSLAQLFRSVGAGGTLDRGVLVAIGQRSIAAAACTQSRWSAASWPRLTNFTAGGPQIRKFTTRNRTSARGRWLGRASRFWSAH